MTQRFHRTRRQFLSTSIAAAVKSVSDEGFIETGHSGVRKQMGFDLGQRDSGLIEAVFCFSAAGKPLGAARFQIEAAKAPRRKDTKGFTCGLAFVSVIVTSRMIVSNTRPGSMVLDLVKFWA